MMKRKSFILMLLFSFLAHMGIAGSLIYAPLRLFGNDRVIRRENVIWGVVPDQVAGENSRGERPSGLSIERLAGRDRTIEVGNKEPEVRSEILMSLRDTKEYKNGWAQEIQAPDFSLDRGFRLKPDTQRGFSSESIKIGRQEREIDGRSGPEVLYSHQETSQSSMQEGCNDSNHCTGVLVADNQTSGEDNIFSHDGERGRDHLKEILEEIRREIERHKYYPPFARKNGIEGTVYVNFYIGSDGRPGSISIWRSSGFKILDDSATRTLKEIKQFPAVPEEIRELDITVPIAYRLTEEKN